MFRIFGSPPPESSPESKPETKEPELIPVIRQDIRKTHIINKRDFPIRGNYRVLEVAGSGKLREFTIISPSNASILKIRSDRDKLLEDTFAQLLALTTLSNTIDAEETADDKFIVNLEDIEWKQNFLIMIVSTGGAITFENIFMIWDERLWEREVDRI